MHVWQYDHFMHYVFHGVTVLTKHHFILACSISDRKNQFHIINKMKVNTIQKKLTCQHIHVFKVGDF